MKAARCISFIFVFLQISASVLWAQEPRISSFAMVRDSAFGSVWDTYDTTLVAYNALQSNGYFGVYFAHVSGNQLINETCFTCLNNSLPGKNAGAPVFQPGGKWVGFVAEKANHPGSSSNSVPGIGSYSDVWVMTRDGQRAYQLTNTPDSGTSGIIFPFFSPDGKEFSWTEMTCPVGINGQQEFGCWVINIADFIDDSINGPSLANIRTINPGGAQAFNEAYGWSPDQSKIIFASCYNQFWVWDDQIYVMDTNGNNINQLTACCDYNEHAFFSPDGKFIVWMTNTGTNSGTTLGGDDWFIMNADSTDKNRLTFFNDTTSQFWTGEVHVLGHGCFSPDGQRIIGDVGGDEPIQEDPSQVGSVYIYNLSYGTNAIEPVNRGLLLTCKVYPNPAQSQLQVITGFDEPLQYTVYNTEGSKLLQGQSLTRNFSVNVGNLASGMYFLSMISRGNMQIAKFEVGNK